MFKTKSELVERERESHAVVQQCVRGLYYDWTLSWKGGHNNLHEHKQCCDSAKEVKGTEQLILSLSVEILFYIYFLFFQNFTQLGLQ